MTEWTMRWRPVQGQFDLFAHVSGDDNPIHVDPEFAAGTAFGRTVSHGMLIYAHFWGMIRAERAEARQRSQEMMFPNPCFTGDWVHLTMTGDIPGWVSMRAVRQSDGAEVFTGRAEIA